MITLLTSAVVALAGTVTLNGAGGKDFPTANTWTGIEMVYWPTKQEGIAFHGRIAPTWGFKDRTPIVFSEFGFLTPVKDADDAAFVRAGLLLRVTSFAGNFIMPIQPGGFPSVQKAQLGFVPGGMGVVDFQWGTDAPFAVGLKGGVGSVVGDQNCPIDATAEQSVVCINWSAGFIGGFSARKIFSNGLAVEALVGPTSQGSIGYAF